MIINSCSRELLLIHHYTIINVPLFTFNFHYTIINVPINFFLKIPLIQYFQ